MSILSALMSEHMEPRALTLNYHPTHLVKVTYRKTTQINISIAANPESRDLGHARVSAAAALFSTPTSRTQLNRRTSDGKTVTEVRSSLTSTLVVELA